MSNIAITPESIILKGYTSKLGACNIEYIIFCTSDGIFMVSSQCGFPQADILYVHKSYVTKIADSLKEFYKISIGHIEYKAYRTWIQSIK